MYPGGLNDFFLLLNYMLLLCVESAYHILSYQITARRLFSLLPANSCFGLCYAQHYSLGVLRY